MDDPDVAGSVPDDDPEKSVDDDSSIRDMLGDKEHQYPGYFHDECSSHIEDLAKGGELDTCEENHWLIQRSDATGRRHSTCDYRFSGTGDLDTEGRLKFGGLTRAMHWMSSSERLRRKRRKCWRGD